MKNHFKRDDNSPGITVHDELRALCAISTSGQLTEKEQERLEMHLSGCSSCRDAMRQFEVVVGEAIPTIAAGYLQGIPESDDSSWSQDEAEAGFFERLALEEVSGGDEEIDIYPNSALNMPPFASADTWRHVWTLYASSILLFAVLGVCTYQLGVRRGASIRSLTSRTSEFATTALEQRLSNARHEYEVARAKIEERDGLVATLQRDLRERSAEIIHLKRAQEKLEGDLRAAGADTQDLIRDRSDLALEFETAQARMQDLHTRLSSVEKQESEYAARAATLQANVIGLTQLLRERDRNLDEQQDLLAHDRDIRELMGARDLYIAEVYDVARTGVTQKPFGRVFYTKGKSLVFYAYDLDQQPGIKTASTFQAWGMSGADRKEPLNLGIFYEDNASNKRWVMRSADPKILAQIDAVFVTVEPIGGSRKPSTKALLFAYLKVDPNHP